MALEHKSDRKMNEGVNIEVNRYPVLEKGKPKSVMCMLSVYSVEDGKGDSTKYSDALKAAFGPALDARMERLQREMEEAMDGDRKAVDAARTRNEKEAAARRASENIAELKEKLSNPLHHLGEEECGAIIEEGVRKLEELGLKVVAERCRDENNNLIMHSSYRVYA